MGVATCVRGSEKREAWLIGLRAGGAGIDLTAADYVILPNPWWNPAVEAQAIDRAHRIGRDGTVIAYRLIAERQTIRRELDPALESEGLVHRLEYPFELCWKPVEE